VLAKSYKVQAKISLRKRRWAIFVRFNWLMAESPLLKKYLLLKLGEGTQIRKKIFKA